MKNKAIRFAALMLIFSFVFTLSACKGDKGEPEALTTVPTTVDLMSRPLSVELIKVALNSVENSTWDGDFSSLTAEQKQTITVFFAEANKPVEFRDGNVYFVQSGVPVAPTDKTTAADDITTAPGIITTTTGKATTAPGNITNHSGETTATKPSETIASTTGKPTTPDQILAAYTDVMNYAKTAKPAHRKLEFQALPKDKQRPEGTAFNTLLPIAETFMAKEGDAKAEDVVAGGDMKLFPVYEASKGCLLTDTGAIKTATCDNLPNGNYKITIILKDETNPERYKVSQTKAPGNIGNMFNPLAKSDVDKEAAGIPGISNLKYDLNYYDCKAILEYNPATKQIVRLEQYLYVLIDIRDGELLFVSLIGTAVLETTLKVWNFKY